MDSPGQFRLIMKNMYENKHKNRSSQYGTVAEGRQKRLDRKSQHRKSERGILFDDARNISPIASPAPCTDFEIKTQKRRLMLQQWKEDKEKKKQKEARNKKKPFLVGAVRAPAAIDALPVVPKAVPSTSGRVTRSQTMQNKNTEKVPVAARNLVLASEFFSNWKKESFAPANATFQPQLKTNIKPGALSNLKTAKQNVTFDPIIKTNKLPIRSQMTNVTAPPHNAARNTRPARQNSRTIDRIKPVEIKPMESKTKSKVQSACASINTRTVSAPSTKSTSMSIKSKEYAVQTKQISVTKHATENTMPSQVNKSLLQSKESSMSVCSKDRTLKVRSQNTSKKNISQTQNKSKLNVPKSESAAEDKLRTPPHEKHLNEKNQTPDVKIHTSPKDEFRTSQKETETLIKRTPEAPPQETTAPSPQGQTESNGMHTLTPEQIKLEIAAMSPRVTMSRGKKNARKEMINKLKDGYQMDDDTDETNVEHFRKQLDSEIKRLQAISDSWHKFGEENIVPEHIQELILAAVGQTRLLISKKLQQFATLIDQCCSGEARPGEGVITVTDLQGFWDMVYMQVENVDMRFMNLSTLRDHHWVMEEKPIPKKKPLGHLNNAKKKTTTGPSKLRATIEANRRAQAEKNPADTNILLTEMGGGGSKNFNAGFFIVKSPVRESNSLLTPAKNTSLLKNVLSSEARKANSAGKNSASRAMMKVSFMAKNLGSEMDLQASPCCSPPRIVFEATPARSILKTPNLSVRKSGRRKSAKTVLFSGAEEMDATEAKSPTAGLEEINMTPTKITETPPKKVRSSRRPRMTRSSAVDQENIEPALTQMAELSPPGRITRNKHRQSLLQEKAASEVVTPLINSPRITRRRTAQVTSVH